MSFRRLLRALLPPLVKIPVATQDAGAIAKMIFVATRGAMPTCNEADTSLPISLSCARVDWQLTTSSHHPKEI